MPVEDDDYDPQRDYAALMNQHRQANFLQQQAQRGFAQQQAGMQQNQLAQRAAMERATGPYATGADELAALTAALKIQTPVGDIEVISDPTMPVGEFEIRNEIESRAYTTFVNAARSLRDCEMATRKAGAVYRAALDALNRAVAPTITGLNGE